MIPKEQHHKKVATGVLVTVIGAAIIGTFPLVQVWAAEKLFPHPKVIETDFVKDSKIEGSQNMKFCALTGVRTYDGNGAMGCTMSYRQDEDVWYIHMEGKFNAQVCHVTCMR